MSRELKPKGMQAAAEGVRINCSFYLNEITCRRIAAAAINAYFDATEADARQQWPSPGPSGYSPDEFPAPEQPWRRIAREEEWEREQNRLSGVIERDRTKTAELIAKLRGIVAGRSWLGEGRGNLAWDDDQYQEEFRGMISEFLEALDPLRALAKDWSDCPKDFQAARIDWKIRAEKAEAESAAKEPQVSNGWQDIATAPERERGKRNDILLGSFRKVSLQLVRPIGRRVIVLQQWMGYIMLRRTGFPFPLLLPRISKCLDIVKKTLYIKSNG